MRTLPVIQSGSLVKEPLLITPEEVMTVFIAFAGTAIATLIDKAASDLRRESGVISHDGCISAIKV